MDRLPPFERVVEAHGPALLRFCVAEVGTAGADDLFQEAMLGALRNYEAVRDPRAIRSWLFTIAARAAIDGRRSERRAPLPVADVAAVAGAHEDAPDDHHLWARVAALPDKQRRAVALRFLADLPHREIGRVMGTSEAAARRNVFEGVATLRRDGA